MTAPKLRFKEFDGNWNLLTFSDVFKFYNTNSYSRALLEENGEIMNIHYGDIHTKFSMLFDVEKEKAPYLSKEIESHKINEDNFLKVGDLVIADASEDYKDIGKTIEIINLNNKKVVAGLHTYIARPLKPFALGFNGYLMQTHTIRTQIQKLATGISVLGISKTNISKVELYLPSPEEQTKIASFLSAVDEKISQLTQKHQLLSQYKQGMMQKLFSQQIRFKADDGSKFEEWVEENILKIAYVSIGLVTTMTTNYREDGVPLIRNSDIKPNKIAIDKLIFLDPNFANSYENRKLKVNDIVTVHTGDVGVSSIIPKELNGAIGFATINTRVINEKVSPYYLVWYFNSKKFINWCVNYSTGDGRQNLNLKDFNTAIIPLPCLAEQTKIAKFLSAIDQKIEVTAQQIEQVKQWKKGLLQQMFV